MPHELTSHKELIIRGDDVFSRESFETPIGGIAELLNEYMNGNLISFINLKFPPVLSKWTTGTYFGQIKDRLLAFFEVEYFPLTGSCLRKNRAHENLLTICVTSYQNMLANGHEAENLMEHEGHPKWMFPESMTAYVMIPFNLQRNDIDHPFFFSLDKDFNPKMIKFPNIFDTGRICTGGSYTLRNDAEVNCLDKVPLLHLKYALNQIHEAPINGDLRQNDESFAQWDMEGNQIETTLSHQYFHTITDDRIVQFANWRKNNA